MGQEFPLLEKPCERCDGMGFCRFDPDDKNSRRYTCGDCNGAGYELTEFGAAVLALVRRHITLSVKAS